jgi:hypothetical protein
MDDAFVAAHFIVKETEDMSMNFFLTAMLIGCLALISAAARSLKTSQNAKENAMNRNFLSLIRSMSLLFAVASAAALNFAAEAVAQSTNPPLPPPPAPVVWDFSLRPALYANGAESKRLNALAKYVTAGKTLTLKKSEAVSCEGDTCSFNLAFFVNRNGNQGELSTYASIRGKTVGIVGNTVTFASGSTVKDMVFLTKLKVGENKLTVEVDPYKKLAETNEQNNSFAVTIIVEP